MVDPEVLAEVTQNQRDLHSKMAVRSPLSLTSLFSYFFTHILACSIQSVQSLDFSALLSSPSTSKEGDKPKETIPPEISKVIDDTWMQEELKITEGGKGKGKGGRKRK